MDDEKIVELFLSRDETAIKRTAEKYGAKLFGMASSILNDPRDAEECINDVYLKAWNSIPPNEPKDRFLPYLLRVTRQQALNRIKHASFKKRSAVLIELTKEMEECIPSNGDPSDELFERELAAEISGFLSDLDPGKRDLFVERYWLFMSYSDIAKSIGSNESRVRTALYRIRKMLADRLRKKGYDV